MVAHEGRLRPTDELKVDAPKVKPKVKRKSRNPGGDPQEGASVTAGEG